MVYLVRKPYLNPLKAFFAISFPFHGVIKLLRYTQNTFQFHASVILTPFNFILLVLFKLIQQTLNCYIIFFTPLITRNILTQRQGWPLNKSRLKKLYLF